jgi:hypothetical protein
MTLDEYVTKYRIDITCFSALCGIPYSTMWTYITGKHKPNQSRAEVIEAQSDKLVSVKEMRRGRDDRERRRRRANDNGSSGEI